ncbi:MAG: FeoA family protein [Negativicutes bacterium]
MGNTFLGRIFLGVCGKMVQNSSVTNLANAKFDKEYTIKEVKTEDEEIKSFLFTLGCYEGEIVTVISKISENYVISVKDARYSIDKDLAEAIII